MAEESVVSGSELSNEIVSRIGQQMQSCQFVAKGSTCIVYRVRTNKADMVLRLSDPNAGKSSRFESDFHIRQALSIVSSCVAVPVATNRDFIIGGLQSDWALDHYCEGITLPRGEIPSAVSEQLGLILSYLHRLPVKGYGKLENSRSELLGCDPDLTTGMMSRFESPWPFSEVPLIKHPSVQAEPDLYEPLSKIEEALRDFGTEGKASLVHGDLHELQFLVLDGQLSALLDFNESFAGRYEWDFGSYMYFHGTESFMDMLGGYSQDSTNHEKITYNAWLASILIALHHGNRAMVLSRRNRLKSSVQYLREAILRYS